MQQRRQAGPPEALAAGVALATAIILDRTDSLLIGDSGALEFIVLSVLFLVAFFVVRALVLVLARDRS